MTTNTSATPSTVLVTGATGNVGRPLVDRLLADGHRVRALSRTPEQARLPEGVEVVRGDLADVASLDGVFDGITAVHLMAFNGADYSPFTTGAEIAALALKAGVRRATVLKGGLEPSPLEEALDASGLPWTGLAPVEFMSNVLEWAEAVRGTDTVTEPFAQVKSAMVHPADIADVAAVALTEDGHGGRQYWLTGPEALTVPEKVRVLGDALGRRLEYVEQSEEDAVALWRMQGFSDDDMGFFLDMRKNPPEAGYTVLPTVEEVTGRPARTFAQWAAENTAPFTA